MNEDSELQDEYDFSQAVGGKYKNRRHSSIGKKLQTWWRCENAQGYFDQVILAFGQLQPTLAFVAEGSVLKAFQSQPIQRLQSINGKPMMQGSAIAD